MRKKILKVFFVILTGITVTLTGCELTQKRKFTKAREIPQIRNLHRKKLMISNISLVIFCIPMKIR